MKNRFLILIILSNILLLVQFASLGSIVPINDNLKPVIFGEGSSLNPKHDGKHYFIAERLPADTISADDVINAVKTARQLGNFANDLLTLNYVSALPAVAEKKINGTNYYIAVERLTFTPNGNFLTIFAMVETSEDTLYFGGNNIRFSGKGGIVEGELSLIVNELIRPIHLGKKVSLEFKGPNNKFKFGCNGFESLSLEGVVSFDRSLMVPETSSGDTTETGNVTTTFRMAEIKDWNDMMLTLSFNQPFQVRSLPGFGFQLKEASLDMSDAANPLQLVFPKGYDNNLMNMGPLWRGTHIKQIAVRFPKQFNKRGTDSTKTKSSLIVGVNDLIFDDAGLSGELYFEKILALEEGDLDGWDFSINGGSIQVVNNSVIAGSLLGNVRIATMEQGKSLGYQAIINPTYNLYKFNINISDSVPFDVFKASSVNLLPNSRIDITLKDKRFYADALLFGSMEIGIDTPKVELAKFGFQKLKLSTRQPYMSVAEGGAFGGGINQTINLGLIPIEIDGAGVIMRSDSVIIQIAGGLAIDNVLTAKAGFSIKGSIQKDVKGRHFWKFAGVKVHEVYIKGGVGNVVQFEGLAVFFSDNPYYGNGFKGFMKTTIDAKVAKFEVKMGGIFGKVNGMNYWNVDGMFTSSALSIPILPPAVAIKGFGGGAFKHMRQVNRYLPENSQYALGVGISDLAYKPDNSVSYGGRFMLGLGPISPPGTPDLWKGELGLEVAISSSGGLSYLSLFGNVEMMLETTFLSGMDAQDALSFKKKLSKVAFLKVPKDDLDPSKGTAQEKAKKPILKDTAKALKEVDESQNVHLQATKDKVPFYASAFLQIDIENNKLFGGAHADMTNPIVNLNANAELYFSKSKWYIYVGKPEARVAVNVVNFFNLDAYFMIGYGIPQMPAPNPNIFSVGGIQRPENMNFGGKNEESLLDGRGLALGANLSIESNFNINIFNKPIVKFSLGANAGFDLMMKQMSSALVCKDFSGPIGYNSWRIEGQAYASIWASLGIGQLEIARLTAGALIGAKLPRPTYLYGELAFQAKLFGFLNANVNVPFEIGTKCDLVVSQTALGGLNYVKKKLPENNDEDVSVFSKPTTTFENKIGEPFTIEGDASSKSYRLHVKEYTLKDADNNIVQGNLIYGSSYNTLNLNPDQIAFEPNEKLKANTRYNSKLVIVFQELTNSVWTDLVDDDVNISQEIVTEFETGSAFGKIENAWVTSAVPSREQFNFYKNETSVGNISLNSYFKRTDFEENGYLLKGYIRNENTQVEMPLANFSIVDQKINFDLPSDLVSGKIYEIKINLEKENEKFQVYKGHKFRVSLFNTIEAKLNEINKALSQDVSPNANTLTISRSFKGIELFDHKENITFTAEKGESWYETVSAFYPNVKKLEPVRFNPSVLSWQQTAEENINDFSKISAQANYGFEVFRLEYARYLSENVQPEIAEGETTNVNLNLPQFLPDIPAGNYYALVKRNEEKVGKITFVNPTVISIKSRPAKPSISANKTKLCSQAPESIVLTASNCFGSEAKVIWYNKLDNRSIASQATMSVSPAQTTTYYAVCEIEGMKSDTSEITINYINAAIPTIESTLDFCYGKEGSLVATASNAESFVWKLNGQNNGTITNNLKVTIPLGANNTFAYSVSAKYGENCYSQFVDGIVRATSAPEIRFEGHSGSDALRKNIQVGDPISIGIQGCDYGPNNFSWSPNLPSFAEAANLNNPITYTFTCTKKNTSCSSSIQVIINTVENSNYKVEKINSDKELICSNSTSKSVTLTAIGNCIGQIKWDNGTIGQTLVVSPTKTTTYTANCMRNDVVMSTTTKLISFQQVSKPTITYNTPLEFCEGSSVILNAKNCTGGSIIWNEDESANTSTFTAIYTSSYVAACKVEGCEQNESSDPVNVVVNPIPSAPSLTATSTSVCVNNEVTVSATIQENHDIKWNVIGLTNKSFKVNPTATVSYSASAISAKGCKSPEASISISVKYPNINIGTPDPNYCVGTTVQLNVNNCASDIQWKGGNIETYSGKIPGVQDNETYTVNCVDLQGCAATASFISKTKEPIKPIVSYPLNACINSSVKINGSCPAGTLTWIVDYNQVPSVSSIEPTIRNNQNIYIAQCNIENSTCGGSERITISGKPKPQAPVLSGTKTICSGEPVSLTVGNCSNGTLEWSNGGALIVKPTSTTKYTVKCNVDGCSSDYSNEVTITVLGEVWTNTDEIRCSISTQDGSKIKERKQTGSCGGTNWIEIGNWDWVDATPIDKQQSGCYEQVKQVSPCGNFVSWRNDRKLSNWQYLEEYECKAEGNENYKQYGIFRKQQDMCSLPDIVTQWVYQNSVTWTATGLTRVNPTNACEIQLEEKPNCSLLANRWVKKEDISVAAPTISGPASICLGETATLSTGTCNGTIQWSTGGALSVSPTTTTTYTAKCNVNGCLSAISNEYTLIVIQEVWSNTTEKSYTITRQGERLTEVKQSSTCGNSRWIKEGNWNWVDTNPLDTKEVGCKKYKKQVSPVNTFENWVEIETLTKWVETGITKCAIVGNQSSGMYRILKELKDECNPTKTEWVFQSDVTWTATGLTRANPTNACEIQLEEKPNCSLLANRWVKKEDISVAAPTISGPASICIGSSANITVSGCSGTIEWSPNGATVVSPTSSTSYWAVCNVGGCKSTTSNQITISVTYSTPVWVLDPNNATRSNTGTKRIQRKYLNTNSCSQEIEKWEDAEECNWIEVTVSNNSMALVSGSYIDYTTNTRQSFSVYPYGSRICRMKKDGWVTMDADHETRSTRTLTNCGL